MQMVKRFRPAKCMFVISYIGWLISSCAIRVYADILATRESGRGPRLVSRHGRSKVDLKRRWYGGIMHC